MVDRAALARMNDALNTYDIDQGGWEHEFLGLEPNLKHVAIHLSRDLIRKDFNDRGVVEDDLLPDAISYALRISRWTESGLAILGGSGFIVPQAFFDRYSTLGVSHTSWIMASGELSDAVHGLDHERERAVAVNKLKSRALNAAGVLMVCAEHQSSEFSLDMERTLARKIESLRIRFGIDT